MRAARVREMSMTTQRRDTLRGGFAEGIALHLLREGCVGLEAEVTNRGIKGGVASKA